MKTRSLEIVCYLLGLIALPAVAEEPTIGGLLPSSSYPHPSDITVFALGRGHLVTGDREGQVRLWQIGTTFEPVRLIKAHAKPVRSLALSHDSKILVTSDGQSTSVWKVATGEQLESGEIGLAAMVFSSDGRTLTGVTDDKEIMTWNTGDYSLQTRATYRDPRQVKEARLSQDGERAVFVMADG